MGRGVMSGSKSWSSTLSKQAANRQIISRDQFVSLTRRKQVPGALRGIFLSHFTRGCAAGCLGEGERLTCVHVCAECGSPSRCVCLLCVPTRVRRHLLRPPSALAAKLRPAGSGGGNPIAEGLNYFSPRGIGPRPHSAVGLGGKDPNPSWGSRVEPGLRSERRWRRRVPEIYFQGRSRSSCSRRSWLESFLRCCCVRGGGKPTREPGFSETGFETVPSPQRLSADGFSKRLERWPGCKNEGTSQALLQGPEGLRVFWDHQARWKSLKYILCVL